MTDVQDAIGRGQGWTVEGVVPPYLVRPLLILILIGAAFFLNIAPNAATGMACALIATAATAAVQTFSSAGAYANACRADPREIDFPAWLKISLPLLAVGASELVLQNADILILNVFRSPSEIGVYYAAVKTTCLALFVHYAVGSAYAGRISAARALDDEAEVHRLAARGRALDVLSLAHRHCGRAGRRLSAARPVRPRLHQRLSPDVHPRHRRHGARRCRSLRVRAQHAGRGAHLRPLVHHRRRGLDRPELSSSSRCGASTGAAIATASAFTTGRLLELARRPATVSASTSSSSPAPAGETARARCSTSIRR
ncbi:MAG: hypothetical protein WDN31_00880 [Hyphomicrobium sp.]